MLRPTIKINCEECGKETEAQNKTKRKCFDCKYKRKKLYSLNYHKKQKYKCINCPDRCYNEVYEPNTRCGLCESIYEKNRVQETNITTSERETKTETRKTEVKNVGKKTNKKSKVVRKKS